MSTLTVILLTLGAAVVIAFGGALLYYMAGLVNSAYDMRVAMRGDLDEGMARLEEELTKKSKWIKRDILDEVTKVRVSMKEEDDLRFNDFSDKTTKQLKEQAEAYEAKLKAMEDTVSELKQRLQSALRARKQKEEEAAEAAKDKAQAKPAAEAATQPAQQAAQAPAQNQPQTGTNG